ncbi:NAD-dependent epimerase/dehydratase family protein [Candidatus Shapirobacteria bacterium]|nr:NAD-dependent epimerase/dehydratase family protein [Candidatus Shapirobacteria bacterium]
MSKKILVTGATGQVGSELTIALRDKFGGGNVIAVGHSGAPDKELKNSGPYEVVDATDMNALRALVEKYEAGIIYHLVGILSAAGEKKPDLAWRVNMESLKNVLDLARNLKLRIFWPSSIAAFGPTTPKKNTPQKTILEPSTIYGVSKVAGELLANYYFLKYGVDVRSLRYPGLISYKTPPRGGTSDYAVAVFFEAVKNKHYSFFVNKETVLPMMYMPDAVKATIEIMEADPKKLTVRHSYNLAAMSFSAQELALEVKKHIPDFSYDFKPDERQKIADSWPKTIDDSRAREDWGWRPEFDLSKTVVDMLENIRKH